MFRSSGQEKCPLNSFFKKSKALKAKKDKFEIKKIQNYYKGRGLQQTGEKCAIFILKMSI